MKKLLFVFAICCFAFPAYSACTEAYSDAGDVVAVKIVCTGANQSHAITPSTMNKIKGRWIFKGATIPSGSPDAAYDIDIKDSNGAPVGGTFLNNRSQTAAEEAEASPKAPIVENLSVIFSNQTAAGATVTTVLYFGK